MTKTDAERKAAERQRKQEQGLKRREFWLTDDEQQLVAEYVKALRLKSDKPAGA